MISVSLSGGHFNYRVAGVCIHDGYVLTHKNQFEDLYALPGGRVEILESSEAALRREMREELGVDIRVERLLWVIENLYSYQGSLGHELGLYYLMSLEGPRGIYDRTHPMRCLDAPELTLQWLPMAGLPGVKLLPALLTPLLRELPASPRHMLHEDYDSTAR